MATEHRSRTFYRWFTFLGLVVAIGAGLWYYFWAETAASYSYETRTVDTGLIEQSVSATGSVQALITVDLSSQLSFFNGLVCHLNVGLAGQPEKRQLDLVVEAVAFGEFNRHENLPALVCHDAKDVGRNLKRCFFF